MATATDLQVLLPIIFDEIFTDLSTNFDEANTGDDLVSILVHLGLLRREYVPRVTLFAEEKVKNFTDWDFRLHFRLSLTTYNILLDKVSKIIEPDNPHVKAYIPAGKQILIFPWFMANTDSIWELSMLFGISKSTVHCTLRRVATAVDSLQAQLITWPTGQTRNCVIDGMAEKLGIQGCVGRVDSTHIRLAVVPNGDQDHVNRKGYPSLVLQVVVDDRMLITDSYVGWPGSTHDARVWRNSPLFQHIQIGRVMEADDFIIGLPKLLEKVEQLSNQPQTVPNPVPAHSQPSQPKRMLSPQIPARVQYVGGQLLSPERATPKSSAQLKRTVFNYPVNENGEVDLGYGVCVGADNLQLISLTDIQKTTYTVCEVVFSRHELANSSLSGRPSNVLVFKDVAVKEKLNEQKVQAVLGVVRQLHPKAEDGAIRKAIGCKLNITQKIVKRSISTPSGSTSMPQ